MSTQEEPKRVVKFCIDTKTLRASQREQFRQYAGVSRAIYNWCVTEWQGYTRRKYEHTIQCIKDETGLTDPKAISQWRKDNKGRTNAFYDSFPEKEPNGARLSAAFTAGLDDPDFPFYWNRNQRYEDGRMRRAVPAAVTNLAFRDFNTAIAGFHPVWKKSGYARRKNGTPVGSPRYKAKHHHEKFGFAKIPQFTNSPKNHIVTGKHRICLPNVGSLRVWEKTDRLARYISDGGSVKSARFTREGERWYVALNVTLPIGVKTVQPRENHSRKVFAGDLGVNRLLTSADGRIFENRRLAQENAERIAALQRKLATFDDSRVNKTLANGHTVKVYKDPRYAKTRLEIKRLSHKMRLQRTAYIHGITKELTTRYGRIVLEDLKVSNMMKAPAAKPDPERPGHYAPNGAKAKAGLSRSIADAAWSELIRQLGYKADLYGSTFKQVNPAYTSRTCHECRYVNKNVLEKWEVFVCESCGHTNDRDINAALNILTLGLEFE